MTAPRAYRAYLDKTNGAPGDGYRFVLDMGKGRKVQRLYCPELLRTFKVPSEVAKVKGVTIRPLLERSSSTPQHYDPKRLKRNLREWAKERKKLGIDYSKRDLEEVLVLL